MSDCKIDQTLTEAYDCYVTNKLRGHCVLVDKALTFVNPGMKVIWQVLVTGFPKEYIATYEGTIDEVFLDKNQNYITVLTAYDPTPKRVSLEEPSLKFLH